MWDKQWGWPHLVTMVTYPQVIFLSNILSLLVFLPSCSLSSFVSYSLPLVTIFSIFIERELIACQMSLSKPLKQVSTESKNLPLAAAAAKSLQSCPTPCDPIDGSPPGSPIPGILQARTLEWVAISFSTAWTWKVKVKSLSRARLLATPWTAAYQAPPPMRFSRQEYWSGLPLPSLKNLPLVLVLLLLFFFRK